FVYAPASCGSPHAVFGGTYPLMIFASGRSCCGRSLWLIGAAVRTVPFCCCAPAAATHVMITPATRRDRFVIRNLLQTCELYALCVDPGRFVARPRDVLDVRPGVRVRVRVCAGFTAELEHAVAQASKEFT